MYDVVVLVGAMVYLGHNQDGWRWSASVFDPGDISGPIDNVAGSIWALGALAARTSSVNPGPARGGQGPGGAIR